MLLLKNQKKKEEVLPLEIREGFNSIRKEDLPFYEKAKKLANLLKRCGCQEIKILDCDVCVTDFFQNFSRFYQKFTPKISMSFLKKKKKEFTKTWKKLFPLRQE